MTKITFEDKEKNREFTLEFDSPFVARKMYNKCRYSKKLKPIKILADSYEEYQMVVGRIR